MTEPEIRTVVSASLDAQPLAVLWNASYGDELALSAAAIQWAAQAQQRPRGQREAVSMVASVQGVESGFAIVSTLANDGIGVVDALAVRNGRGQTNLRRALLRCADEWFRQHGCSTVTFGGGVRSLLRGSQTTAASSRALQTLGFVPSSIGDVADMAVDVARYRPPAGLSHEVGVARSALVRDLDDILALLDRAELASAASGVSSSAAEVQALRDFCEAPGRLSDLMLLWTPRGLQGLCQLVFADSTTPIEIAYPWRLPRQWSMIRSILAAQDLLEESAALLLDAALRRLHNNGVNSCVMPAVAATATFEDLGFYAYRRWRPMAKVLGNRAAEPTSTPAV